jgi:hypothetical protein
MKHTKNGKTSSNFYITSAARKKIRDIQYVYATQTDLKLKNSDVINRVLESLSVEDVVKLLRNDGVKNGIPEVKSKNIHGVK